MTTYLLLLAVMILWGAYPIFAHYFVRSLDPLFLVSISAIVASFPFILQLIYKKTHRGLISKTVLQRLIPVTILA